MARKSPAYEAVRQNLVYLRSIVQTLVDDGHVEMALTCTEENIATAKAFLKLANTTHDA